MSDIEADQSEAGERSRKTKLVFFLLLLLLYMLDATMMLHPGNASQRTEDEIAEKIMEL